MSSVGPELWTIQQVADHLGIRAPSARGTLSRWGIKRHSVGESGAGRMTALYEAARVREAAVNRPGRGARTDRQA
jgi:hypothetical protein